MASRANLVGSIVVIPWITKTRVDINCSLTCTETVNTLRGTGPCAAKTAVMASSAYHAGPVIIKSNYVAYTLIATEDSIVGNVAGSTDVGSADTFETERIADLADSVDIGILHDPVVAGIVAAVGVVNIVNVWGSSVRAVELEDDKVVESHAKIVIRISREDKGRLIGSTAERCGPKLKVHSISRVRI
jgi:hypothetical protein